MNEKKKADANSGKQSIEELQKRYQKLDKRKTEAEIHLKNATKQLEELKKESREKYGTDDVTKLREKLDTMTSENEEKRRKYQADLDQIESDLADVEEKFAAAEIPPTAEEKTE